MNRTRKNRLKDLVFQKTDLRKIWQVLEACSDADGEVAKKANSFRGVKRPTITIQSVGQISETMAEDAAVFDNDVLDSQKSISIQLKYENYAVGKAIRVDLAAGHAFKQSDFTVSGDDTSWVDARFAELERIFAAVKPQSTIAHKYRFLVITPLAAALGYTFLFLYSFVIPKIQLAAPAWLDYVVAHDALRGLFILGLSCLVGWIPATIVEGWVEKLWPSIEFDFGPEHLNQEKNIRFRLGVVFSLLVIPIFLMLADHYMR